jgi:hypothetical protein
MPLVYEKAVMIEINQLTEKDIGRRVLYEVAPGIENPARLGAWTEASLIIFILTKEHKGLHPVFDVNPAKVRWADRLINPSG